MQAVRAALAESAALAKGKTLKEVQKITQEAVGQAAKDTIAGKVGKGKGVEGSQASRAVKKAAEAVAKAIEAHSSKVSKLKTDTLRRTIKSFSRGWGAEADAAAAAKANEIINGLKTWSETMGDARTSRQAVKELVWDKMAQIAEEAGYPKPSKNKPALIEAANEAFELIKPSENLWTELNNILRDKLGKTVSKAKLAELGVNPPDVGAPYGGGSFSSGGGPNSPANPPDVGAPNGGGSSSGSPGSPPPGPGTGKQGPKPEDPKQEDPESTKTEPQPSQPTGSQPTGDQPTGSQTTSIQPTATGPTAPEPTAPEPTATQPAPTEPTSTEPTAPEPTQAVPEEGEPVFRDYQEKKDFAEELTSKLNNFGKDKGAYLLFLRTHPVDLVKAIVILEETVGKSSSADLATAFQKLILNSMKKTLEDLRRSGTDLDRLNCHILDVDVC